MARQNNSNELWTAVSEGGLIIDETTTPQSDVLLNAATAGATALTETTGSNSWVAGDILRIGAGSTLEVAIVEAYTTPTITLVSPLAKDAAAGSVLQEQRRVDLGAISDDGVNRENAVERNEIRAVTQAGNYAVLTTSVTGRITWNLLNHSLENVLAAMGIQETNIAGAGTAADPYVADIDFDKINERTNTSLYFLGALRDGTVIEIQGWGADYDGNQTVTYLRGQAVTLPMAADVGHFRYYQPQPAP